MKDNIFYVKCYNKSCVYVYSIFFMYIYMNNLLLFKKFDGSLKKRAVLIR